MRNKENRADIVVVGGGIVGVAHAYMAAKKGHSVVLLDRNEKAIGASIRNFGLIWPIGQAKATWGRAMRSRKHWLEVAEQAKLPLRANGSMHLAYHQDEWDVLHEFMQQTEIYGCALVSAKEACQKNSLVKKEGLLGALWSPTELTVDPRESLKRLPLWLEEKYGVVLRYGALVKEVAYPKVITGSGEVWHAERVFVCGGADFETLYPEIYRQAGLEKCKLQMMRAVSPVEENAFGPSLCAGLTLGHYASFGSCPSLERLKTRFDNENPAYSKNGIHVLLALNGHGELVIGDSHHYGLNPEPFDSEEINQLILKYLASFTHLKDLRITERWHGIYPKIAGKTEFMIAPEPGVKIVNGLGGAGMTLSFGLAEENIELV